METKLFVDVRRFSTIYKRVYKGWKLQIIEIIDEKEIVIKTIKSKGILTVEDTNITKPGRYKAKLIGPKPLGLVGCLLNKKSEVIESQVKELKEGEIGKIIFKREDVIREKPSFRADAPYRINPEFEIFPLLVEIVDLPCESKKIKLKSIHICDILANRVLKKEEIVKVEDEEGFEIYDNNGKPTIIKEEEINSGIFVQNNIRWYRVIYLRHKSFVKDKNDNIYIRIYFIFENRAPFETSLKIYVSPYPLPKFNNNWYYGDIHYHSEFTHNLTEFGGPMRMAKAAGIVLGLNWVNITDHSCDFSGDKEFSLMKNQAKSLSENYKFLLISSEEITVKKPREFLFSDFLHLLYNNADKFIEGTFEGTFDLIGVFGFLKPESFAFAAHPTSFPNWEEEDKDYQTALKYENFLGLQIFNAKAKSIYSLPNPEYRIDMFRKIKRKIPFNLKKLFWRTFSDYLKQWERGVKIWDKFLKEGLNQEPARKLFIVGGSDAHGDFNFGILVNPLTGNLMTDNAFGKVRTLAYCEELREERLMESLKKGRCIVTDGPIATFKIKGINNGKEVVGDLGDEILISEKKIEIEIEWKSTKEFGKIKRIKLIRNGEILNKDVLIRIEKDEAWAGKKIVKLYQEEDKAYYRIELFSNKRREKFCCYTNPIWVKRV